jgi:hypothetical protein
MTRTMPQACKLKLKNHTPTCQLEKVRRQLNQASIVGAVRARGVLIFVIFAL